MTRRVLGKRGRTTDASTATGTNGHGKAKRSTVRRDGAWIIRSLNQSLMPDTRWADCGNPIGARVAVKRLEDERGTMQPSTIATCASPWACLSCAAKVRSHKAREIDALAKAHLAAGGGLTFVTITFPHYLADSLEDSLTVVRKGWKSLVSGSGYVGKRNEDTGEFVGGAKNRWGIIGNVRAIEITDGTTHGWHPHLHVLCFHDAPLSPEDGSLQEFRAWWSDRWARWVKRTLDRDIHTERGVDAVPVKDNAGLGDYVSKIHFELVRSDLKRGRRQNRTPWQIALDGAETGDCRDMARWVEYCQATKGRWVVSGLSALRAVYSIDVEDLDDEEAAAQTQDGTLTAFVDGPLWRAARRITRRPVIAEALTALETGRIRAMAEVFATVDPTRRVRWDRRTDGVPIIEWEDG